MLGFRSKRDILLPLLHEAELCLQLKAVRAAVVLAGVLLEEASQLGHPKLLEQQEDSLNVWRDIRDRAAYSICEMKPTRSYDVPSDGGHDSFLCLTRYKLSFRQRPTLPGDQAFALPAPVSHQTGTKDRQSNSFGVEPA